MHTAGDWEIAPHSAHEKQIEITVDGSPYPLAWVDNDDVDEANANAALIAAAPTMLEALRAVMGDYTSVSEGLTGCLACGFPMGDYGDEASDSRGRYHQGHCPIGKVDAAIKAATGDSVQA